MERNDINYGTVGGYTNEYSPGEIGLGTDWDARGLILAEQERAKQPGYKAAPDHYAMSGFSCEVNGSELTIHNGQTVILVRSGDIAKLAQACSQAMQNQNGKSARYW
jgi:hypothetical protein